MTIAIALDLGGTQVRAARVRQGKLLDRAAALTDVAGGPQAILAQFDRLIEKIGGTSDVAAIGISSPGPLDTATGVILNMPSLPGWDGFALRDHFAQCTDLPVTLENDGIAAAYGEWQYGAGRGLQHLVCVAVGTGIGGGVIVDGQVLHGRRGMASHVGHFQMVAEGPRCSCGAIGCFEALASGKALIRNALEGVAANAQSQLAQLAPGQINGAAILDAARAGDTFACQLLDQEADYLGRGFASLAHLFSPDRIVMGGGVSKAFDFMAHKIRAAANERFMTAFDEIEINEAELGEDAALIGAAAQAIDSIN